MLKLSRPLCVCDTETTGLDPTQDRIITLGVEFHMPEGGADSQEWKFNPQANITPENSAVHGITNEMVASWPKFESKAKFIFGLLKPCDFAGFNVNFDLSVLSEEFNRCGLEFDLTGKAIIDVGLIYKKRHPRTLEAAVQQYCGHPHEGAHGALADAKATREVLEAMMETHESLAETGFEGVAQYSMVDERDGSVAVTLDNTLRKRKDGVIVYGTKRNRGVAVKDDPGYAQWILRTSFPSNTHRVVRKVLEEIEKTYQLRS